MGKLNIIKGIVSVICIVFILFPAAASAGFPEPGVLIYGRVTDVNGELVLNGTITLTITPAGSETPVIEKQVQMGEIDSNDVQYSYRILLDMETPMTGFSAATNAIQLSETDVTYNWTATAEDLGITVAGTFDLGYGDCGTGRYIPIDARLPGDADNDGLPDEWEVMYQLSISSGDGDDGPDGDPDNDGLTNLEEYLLGTDPKTASIVTPNTCPSVPSLNFPADGAELTVLQPVLSVNNAEDPDADEITYEFEVYRDEALTSRVSLTSDVAEEVNVTTITIAEILSDNTVYYWRARAFDGFEYSSWTDVNSFFVNTENDPPGIPVLSYPRDGSGISDLQPSLKVLTVSDPDMDTLYYEFVVYSNASLTIMAAGPGIGNDNESGECSWTVDSVLTDGATYYWIARTVDNEGAESGWTGAGSFTINSTNQSPTPPVILSPVQGEEIVSLPVELAVTNGSDADGDTLVYEFQMDSSGAFDSAGLETSGLIDEDGSGETSWTPSSNPADNTTYYWRVCVYDGQAYSPWVQGSFFVNTENSAPTVPGILNPGDGSSVSDFMPLLSLLPAQDDDGDTLTYDYEVYTDESLDGAGLVASVQGADTSWQVTAALGNKSEYFWRARAVDGHGLAGSWSESVSFIVNVNTRPTAPVLNNPVSGGIVTSLSPTLSVRNADNPDGDTLFYAFELYSDSSLENLTATGLIGEDTLITSWTVSVTLTDNTTWYWRARAFDGILEGPWTPTAVFTVNTGGADTVLTTEAAVEAIADATDSQVVRVTDEQSPIYGVSITIPPGALDADCTVTISYVENPPALPANNLTLGKVMEFGPHGITFQTPVTIAIPYTQEDLASAGVSDPSQLSVMTYDPTTLSWIAVPVSSVDTNAMTLMISVNHFSVYSMCMTVKPPTSGVEATSSSGGGGGGGGCFITTALYNE